MNQDHVAPCARPCGASVGAKVLADRVWAEGLGTIWQAHCDGLPPTPRDASPRCKADEAMVHAATPGAFSAGAVTYARSIGVLA